MDDKTRADKRSRSRAAGGIDPPDAHAGSSSRPARSARRALPRRLRALADQPAALAEFQGQPARLLVAVDFSRAVRRLAVRRIHRQRQAALHPLRRQVLFSGLRHLSGDRFRRRFRDRRRLSRSLSAEADRREGRHHDLAADPLFLRHAQSRSADAGAVEADLDADRGAMQAGASSARASRAAAISNTTGSAPTTRAATCWRA